MTRFQAMSIGTVAVVVLLMLMVEGRVPSPNPDVPHVARADSEAVPARPPAATTEAVSVDGGGEDGSGWTATWIAGSPTPASTVTTQALEAAPSATAYVAIDTVPATPVATSRPLATLTPQSTVSALIAASPWPPYLWGTVACLVERESGGDAGAVGKLGEVGLVQVGPANYGYLAGYGITPSMLYDPAVNLRAGWLIYLYWQRAIGDGFAAWTTRGGCV